MFIFERLRNKTRDADKMKICYVIILPRTGRVEFYTQDRAFCERLCMLDNPVPALMDFYLSQMKTYRQERKNDDLLNSTPANYICFNVPLAEWRAEQDRRRLAGKKCRLKLEP